MQTLGVVPRLFPDIVAGRKTSTIRWREGPIVPGLLRYVCDDDPALMAIVRVTRVTAIPLRAAAAWLGRQDDWPDAVMLEGMREHYPAITLDDIVDVVEHLTPEETDTGRHDPADTTEPLR
ncbi:ASCH domain-containing protein [Aquibium sp. LZ166]|uniref:ASCH domain-containing protein n=1 Tax=Aquibium pacificus TaxID=3153579 RepID=A0ABV3SIV7_9HYPH